MAPGEDQGLVKTVFEASIGKLLGAHMVGAEVTELIHGFVSAMKAALIDERRPKGPCSRVAAAEAARNDVTHAQGKKLFGGASTPCEARWRASLRSSYIE